MTLPKSRQLAWLLLAAVWPLMAEAADVSIRFDLSTGQDQDQVQDGTAPAIPARLHLAPDAPTGSAGARDVETTIPGSTRLDLPAGSRWRLSVLADDYWVEPRELEVGTEPSVVPLTALPAGYLKGRADPALPPPTTPPPGPQRDRASPAPS